MIDTEAQDLRRPRSLQAQRGYDKVRYIRDHLIETLRNGGHVDAIMIRAETHHDMQRAWLEMAPENAPMPEGIFGIKTVVDTSGALGSLDYAFLRDWHPWEKRRMLAEGSVDGYREGAKTVTATGERR